MDVDELEGILEATRHADRKRWLVMALEAVAVITTGLVLVAGLYYVYSRLGGLG